MESRLLSSQPIKNTYIRNCQPTHFLRHANHYNTLVFTPLYIHWNSTFYTLSKFALSLQKNKRIRNRPLTH